MGVARDFLRCEKSRIMLGRCVVREYTAAVFTLCVCCCCVCLRTCVIRMRTAYALAVYSAVGFTLCVSGGVRGITFMVYTLNGSCAVWTRARSRLAGGPGLARAGWFGLPAAGRACSQGSQDTAEKRSARSSVCESVPIAARIRAQGGRLFGEQEEFLLAFAVGFGLEYALCRLYGPVGRLLGEKV